MSISAFLLSRSIARTSIAAWSLARPTPSGHLRTVTSMLMLVFCLLEAGTVCGQQDAPIGRDEAVPVITWDMADKVVGREVVVGGKVIDIGHTEQIHFLNFDQDRNAFKLVIFKDSMEGFEDSLENLYQDKLITVRGIITLYAGNPQIVVRSPDQIRVVSKLPETFLPAFADVSIGSEIKIATFNVRNLFDDSDDPYHQDESTPAKPRDEMTQLAGALRDINADIVAMQEVESRGYLRRFLEVFAPELGYRHVVHFEGNDLRGIDVCLISRVPVGRVVSHRHLRHKDATGQWRSFSRDVIRVELLPGGGTPFEMWVVHLKSNHGGREAAEPIRLAEAKQLNRLLTARLKQNPNADVIVCGDFNDMADSETIRTVVGATGDGEPLLKSLYESVPAGERITYNRAPYEEMIDFIFVSAGMAQRYVPRSYAIRTGTLSAIGSDHNPVYCRFYKTKPTKEARK